MKSYFRMVKGKIRVDGPISHNHLAFKFYRLRRKVGGMTTEEHFCFAVAYWHTMKEPGGHSSDRRPRSANRRLGVCVRDPDYQQNM